MSEITVRSLAKAVLLQSIRRLLRSGLHYVQRIGRWPIILWHVRGTTWKDEWTLVRCALASPFLSIKNLMQWQDPILLADAQVDVRGVGRFLIRARCDDLWHVLPWRENAIFSVFHDTLRPGDNFIDAGANIGFYTVLAARLVGPDGKVIAVEMMPDTADQLTHNLALNRISNVTVCRKALSNISGQTVTAVVTPGKYGQASIAKGSSDDEVVRLDVRTTTLDEISSDLSSVRLIKMDLEGAEAAALQGTAELLHKTDFLIYESWGMSHTVSNPVDSCLHQTGYVLNRIDGNNWLASHANHSAVAATA
jgi:FkbM family methyltransferase